MSVYCLNDLDNDKNTLSKQLKNLTGDEFSAQKFYSAHDPSTATPAGVLVHKETGKQFFVPFVADPKEDDTERCLRELRRIVLFEGGCGGYQWGDTRNADGNFGGNRLDKLEEFGLVERTGRSVQNQLGGSWPEVQVTDLGKQVIEGERLMLGRLLETRKLLDQGLIPKSVLVAAEIAREQLGPKFDSEIGINQILNIVDSVWAEMKERTPGLESMESFKGRYWLQKNLEDFAEKHKDYSPILTCPTYISISPAWNAEVGTQVHATFFKNTGKYYAEGIVNMPGAVSYDRDTVLDAFRENQAIISKDFYRSPFTVVMRDAPVNENDPLYKEFFTRMTQAEDFKPPMKMDKSQKFDNSEVLPYI